MTTIYDVEKRAKQLEKLVVREREMVEEASNFNEAERIYRNSPISEIREIAFRKMIIFAMAK